MVDSRQCKLFVPEDKKQYIKGEIGERMAADNFSNSASLQCMHRTLTCHPFRLTMTNAAVLSQSLAIWQTCCHHPACRETWIPSICTMPDAVTHVGEWCSRRSSWMTHSYLRFTLW